MSIKNIKNLEFFFDDPRFRMTWAGRFLTRVGGVIGFLLAVFATLTFLFSDLRWIRAIGVFLALLLLDRLVHWRDGDRPLSELPRKGRVNLRRYAEPKTLAVLGKAFERSAITHRDVFLEICRELLRYEEVEDALRRLDVKTDEFRQKAEDFLAESSSVDNAERRQKIEQLMLAALKQAGESGRKFIDLPSLFSGLSGVGSEYLDRLFYLFGIEAGDLESVLVFTATKQKFGILRRIPATISGFIFESHTGIRHRFMNRAWTSRPTPILDSFSSDLTDLARGEAIGFLIGHEREYKQLVDALSRPIAPNAMLVGEAGIGKDTIINHLAFMLTRDEVPPALFDKRLVALDLANLVAGANPDELQARLQKIVEEINAAGNIILYIPDIHNLVKTSGTAYLSAADALMPIIKGNTFPCIGSSYPREFKQFLEPRSDFVGAFEIISVEEISEAEAEKVLTYESLILERRSKCEISFGAIKTAVKLAKRYVRNKYLPASAAELLRNALSAAVREGQKSVGPDEITAAAESATKIPIRGASGAEAKELLNLETKIHERMVDQEEAVKAVADALREYRSGLSRPDGPIANFLFVGPTGVGKTELAKILSKIQFGSSDAMVRFDMSEYQDKQSFYRFIGSPDGSISGALTDAVLAKPYCLILLDEFEKAFPDILNLFLQVFDDGRLTDNLSRTVDFTNTIIIATSNAHSDIINESLRQGQSMSDIAEYLKKKLTDVFKPELLNRFSRVVVFRDLSPKDISQIAAIQMKDLTVTLATQGVELSFDDEVVSRVAKLGYDPQFGARPLRRVIADKIRAPLAKAILASGVARGAKIKVTVEGGEFTFRS